MTERDAGAVGETANARAAFVVGAGIFLSRIVGLLRTLAFAAYFGAGAAADAYNAAFKIPNAIRNLLGEGTLSASFVPVYSAMLARGDERAARLLARTVLGMLMAAVAVFTLLGIAAAPLLVSLFSGGFDGEKRDLTIRITRVLFPMTAVMVLSGWCLGVQNSHRRFFWSYASAAMWSLAQIALLLGWGSRARDDVQLAYWLAWATLAGSVLQVAVQLPEVVRLAGSIRPTVRRHVEGAATVLRNVVPVLAGLGVTQISGFVDLGIASFLPDGATSLLSYANQIAFLPVSIFGISVAASSLPDLSRDGATGNVDALRERLRAGWQRILFYMVPSAVVFITLGDYCVGILLRAGKFGPPEQQAAHWVLGGYALGIVSYGSVKLMASAYYAMQDYKTPVRASIASVVVSAVTAASVAIAMRDTPRAAAGIALGSALGSYMNLALLLHGLRSRLGPLYTSAMWRGSLRIAGAAAVAGVVALAAGWGQRVYFPELHPRLAGPPILAAFGVLYLGISWMTGSREAARWLRLRPRGS